MEGFKVVALSDYESEHWKLLIDTLKVEENFSTFSSFYKRLFRGQFLVHKNHFKIERLCFFSRGQLRIAGLVFLPQPHWPGPGGVGCLALDDQVTNEQIANFWQSLKKSYSGITLIAPFLGHHYLGFSLPNRNKAVDSFYEKGIFAPTDPEHIGVMTSALNKRIESMFSDSSLTPIYRRYDSLETTMTAEVQSNLLRELQDQPKEFEIREFKKCQAKKDLSIMNRLVNACFSEHFDFCPLTDDENWDIMKWCLLLWQKGNFLFLMKGSQEIGFAFGLMDYNQVFRGRYDLLNFCRFILHRRRISRARLIHIGILQQYRGRKLVKYLRHRLILNLAGIGAKVIESSYIDQDNVASLQNVKSTGAIPINRFFTFKVSN